MEYLAFKNLTENKRGILISPIMRTRWSYILWQDGLHPALTTSKKEVEQGHGIFAATREEAAKYEGETYLVAPIQNKRGKITLALAEEGWRSSGAVVVAGPFELDDDTPYETIIASWLQGYRQVPGVLIESLEAVGRFDEYLNVLVNDPDVEIRRYVAEMGIILPHEIINTLANDPDAVVRCAVAEKGNLPDEIIRKLAFDPDARVRRTVAWRDHLPEIIVRQLASDEDASVRRNIADKPFLPSDVVAALASDPDSWVQERMARIPHLTADVVRTLADSPFELVRQVIAHRDDLPDDVVQKLMHDPSDIVRSTAELYNQKINKRTSP